MGATRRPPMECTLNSGSAKQAVSRGELLQPQDSRHREIVYAGPGGWRSPRPARVKRQSGSAALLPGPAGSPPGCCLAFGFGVDLAAEQHGYPGQVEPEDQ